MLLAAPAARVVIPVTFRAPLWVTAPAVVTFRVPDTVEAPKMRALTSRTLTLLPLVTATVLKLLAALFREMLLAAPAASVVTPVTARAPLWVRAPAVVTPKVPEIVEAPRSRALASVRLTLSPLVTPTVLKSLPALLSVMLLAAPAARVVIPVTFRAPLWVTAPAVVTFRVPDTVEAPKMRALTSRTLTLLPLVTATVLKLLAALFRVMLLAAPAASVVTPVTARAPLWVTAPAVVTPKVPEIVEAPRSRALASVRLTLSPLVTPTVLKSLPALLSVMLLAAPAARVVIPVTFRAPLWVTAPAVVTFRVPDTVEAPKMRALTSRTLTLLPLVTATVLKLLAALFRVMLLAAPAASVVTPVTARAPLWVTAPAVVTPKVPEIVEAPRSRALASVRLTLSPLVTPTVLKSLPALLSVMLLAAPAARVVIPVTFRAPLWVTAPAVVTFRVPDTVEAPKMRALTSRTLTLLPLVTATVLKLLAALFRVMLLAAPAASVVTPVTARAPLWVTAPAVVTPKVPEIVEAPRSRALASVRLTLSPLVTPTVLKSLPALLSVMLLAAPAARVVIPVTFRAPLWVTAPAVVTFRVPDTVEAPKMRALTSRTLTLLPLVTATVLKLLAALFRVMLLAAPAASVVTPVTARAPLWVTAPAVVTPKVPEIVEAPRSRALASVRLTLSPLVTPTVLKSLPALLSVMLLAAPAARVVIPVTFRAPLWVTAPAVVTFRVPDTVEAPKMRALTSRTLTLLPLVTATVLKLLAALFRVMLLAAPAASVVTPVTARAPLWVTAPAVVTPKVPEIVEAPRSRALASVRLTLSPLVTPTVLKSLPALLSVMLLAAPAARVVIPVTFRAPLWVTAPAVVTFRVPDTVEAPKMRALTSRTLTLLPLVTATVLKLLAALFRVMLLAAPAASVVTPVTARAPLWVPAPAVVTPKVPEIVEAPRSRALASFK